jgi:hypothetical protein
MLTDVQITLLQGVGIAVIFALAGLPFGGWPTGSTDAT